MKLVNYEYDSTLFNIDFQNKINLLVSESGTGKTFLLRALKYYCGDNDILSTHIDYTHRNMFGSTVYSTLLVLYI